MPWPRSQAAARAYLQHLPYSNVQPRHINGGVCSGRHWLDSLWRRPVHLRRFALELGEQDVPAQHRRANFQQVAATVQRPQRLRLRVKARKDGLGGRRNVGRQEVRGNVQGFKGRAHDDSFTPRIVLDGPRRGVCQVLVDVLHGVDGVLARSLRTESEARERRAFAAH